MIEENIFTHKLFLPLIFPILVYFLCKNCNSPWKSHPALPLQSPLNTEILSSPSLFENLVKGSTHLSETGRGVGGGGGGRSAHYVHNDESA